MRKPQGIPEQRMNPVTLTVEDPPDRSMTRVKFRALLKITVNTLMGVNQEQIGKTGRTN